MRYKSKSLNHSSTRDVLTRTALADDLIETTYFGLIYDQWTNQTDAQHTRMPNH